MDDNFHTDISSVSLSFPHFNVETRQELAYQVIPKKMQEKASFLVSYTQIHYPNPISIEQSSSELTARYGSRLIEGNTLLDLTGGFGVESFYFVKPFGSVIHCEQNCELSDIVSHNFKVTGVTDIKTICAEGITHLLNSEDTSVGATSIRRKEATQGSVSIGNEVASQISLYRTMCSSNTVLNFL